MSASSKRIATVVALAFAVSAAFGSSGAGVAHAEGTALDCPSSSEEGQRLRDKNKYSDARVMFRACSQATCPGIVRKDCSKWLAELDESQPSIVIGAQDAMGVDLSAVRVVLDDTQVASRIDGSSIAVDPGEHTLRVETAGHAPVVQRVIVRVNEKNRLFRIVFQDGPAPPSGAPKRPAPVASSTDTRVSSGPPVLGFVLTGVGVLGVGSFAYFGLTAKSDLQGLRADCAPFCDQAKLDDVKSRMLVGDISLGVGIVALGLALVVFATHGSPRPAARTAARTAARQ